jgi:hypothetical protein
VGDYLAALLDILATGVRLPHVLPDRRSRARPALDVGQRMEKHYLGDAPSAAEPLCLADLEHPGGLFRVHAVDMLTSG